MTAERIKSFFTSGDQRSLMVKRNAAFSILLKGLSILVSLLLVPITIGYVSAELYGVWLTLSSVTLWFGILDAGFSLGLKNRLAEALARGQETEARQYVSTTYAVMLLIFVPLGIVLYFLAGMADWASLLNVSPAYEDDILRALRAIIVCFSAQMILGVINAVLAANQKVAVSSLLYFIGNLTSLVVIYVLTLTTPPSLFLLSLCQASIPVAVLLFASLFLFATRLKAQRPHPRLAAPRYVRSLLSLGYKFFILQIQVIVVGQTTNFLISYVSGPSDVTAFNIAYRYLGVVAMTFMLVIDPLWPAFTEAYTQGDTRWMQRTYEKMSSLRLCAEALVVVLMLTSPIAYRLWVGASVAPPVVMTVAVSLYFMAQTWMALNITLINGIGCIALQTRFAGLVSLAHIPLSLLLGRHIGAVGVVVSLITLNLVYAAFSTIQIRKILYTKATGIWIR